MIQSTFIFDLGLVIIIATSMGILARLLKQPLIPAYILAGLLIGPGLGIIKDPDAILMISEIGVAFLLFMVGMELHIDRLKSVIHISVYGSLLQMIILFLVGAFLTLLFPVFSTMDIIYIGVIVTFSSTMVVVKHLSDKKEIETLHSRIIIGFLLMEDLVAILILSTFASLGNLTSSFLFIALLKGIALVALALAAGKYLLPELFKFVAKSVELLFLTAIMVCFFFSMLAQHFGFSISIGSFLAGISLAHLPYTTEILGRVRPLRDFFATIFFASLGLSVTFSNFSSFIWPIFFLIILITILKPLLGMVTCSLFGYRARPAFLVGITRTQISEFGLIIAAQGILLGHISKNLFSITVILAIITITVSSYLIDFKEELYQKNRPHFQWLNRLNKAKELEYLPKRKNHYTVLVGYDRVGFSILKKLRSLKKHVLIVDYNPEVIKELIRKRIPCLYGDAADHEVQEKLEFSSVEMLISTQPDIKTNLHLVIKMREENPKGVILVVADKINNALMLYEKGVDYVILPHFIGGDHASLLIEQFHIDASHLANTRKAHINELKNSSGLGLEHPTKMGH